MLRLDAVDFSFYLSLTRDKGVRLFDVHYKGKRILYEVKLITPAFSIPSNLRVQFGLDEAIAHYA